MKHIRELEEHQEEFHRFGCKVVAVHYYKMENLEKWRNWSKCQHQTIADPQRLLYKLFGVGRPPARKSQWSIRSTNAYAGHHAKSETAYADTELGDALQLGGDVVVDDTGRVVFNYRSTWPPDRVSAKDLISALKEQRKH